MQQQFNLEEVKTFIRGTHLVTIFHNESNLFSVVKIRVNDTNLEECDETIVVAGNFPELHDQEEYKFYGKIKEHPRFGLQFAAEKFERPMPESREGVIAYLSSNMFKGIGKKTAESIVDELGEDAISKILRSPSVLDAVPKLSGEKASLIVDTLIANQGLEHVMVTLTEYGFSPQMVMKIFQVYKENTIEIITENPYKLITSVDGIGFHRADELAKKLGFDDWHEYRIQAAALFTLDKLAMSEGHTYITAEALLENTAEMLSKNSDEEISFEKITDQLAVLEALGQIIYKGGRFFSPALFYAEKGITKHVNRIISQDLELARLPESEFLKHLGDFEERLDIAYAKEQKEAVYKALFEPMMILTGGPGTGKTTVIKGILELYSELHCISLDRHAYKDGDTFPVLLAAPTGRAAKRMTEATGITGVTIHRLLGWNGAGSFQHNEEEPLAGELLIVDETSMIDTILMNQLLKSVPKGMQVIFVGDDDQLPSVGPGQVLKDLLKSEKIPTVKLDTIFRQGDGSSIVSLAQDMKRGQIPDNIFEKTSDRSFLPCGTEQILDVVRQVSDSAKRKGYGMMDMQVLAPMYKGAAGIDALNKMLQELLNGNEGNKKRQIQFGEDIIYRVGDKVLQLVNRPDDNIFNGDMGEIISIVYAKENVDKQDIIYVSYDGNEVGYTRQEFIQLTHAFCCSIHKSQGCEFPLVILPVVKGYHRMLQRNLIYTAITRSKQFLVLCGDVEALKYGVGKDYNDRQTSLYNNLIGDEAFLVGEIEANELNDIMEAALEKNASTEEVASTSMMEVSMSYEEALMDVDPMIGMENISPYNFLERS